MNNREHVVTPVQLQIMLDIISLNPELISGKLTENFRREDRKKKWEAIATLLNSGGLGPERDACKWRKIWTNHKVLIRCKATRIQRNVGGSGSRETLTELEKRVLELIGPDVTVTSDFKEDDENGLGTLDMREIFEEDFVPVLTIDDDDSEASTTSPNRSASTRRGINGAWSSQAEVQSSSRRTANQQTGPTNEQNILPAKRRRINTRQREIINENKLNLKESLSAIHKQMELQTAALMEQTTIMADLSQSLQQVAESFKNM